MMKSPSWLSSAPLLLSGGALLVAGYAAWNLRTTARETRRIALADPAEDLLAARLTELEQSLRELERSARERGAERRAVPEESTLRENEEETDRLAELTDRVERLERDQRPDLAAQRSTTEKARVHAVGALRDTTDERIVDPLLQVFASDPSPRVRGRAARILGSFLQLERVEHSLRTALEVETDPNTAADIRRALGLLRKGND